MSKPKILLFDIETAPVLGYVWSLWKQNVPINMIHADTYMLCWAAKWLDDDDVMSDSLPNHKKHYKLYPDCDLKVCETLWTLLDEADIIIGHNGDKFDIPRANARFIHHGMTPPAPSKQVDTYKIAKQMFNFTSNKLDWIGEHLGVGRKVHHDGFDLWRRCLNGDRESWDDMVTYCRGDVVLLESVYKKLRPWARTHPNVNLYDHTSDYNACPACQSENFIRSGSRYTAVGKYQRYQCQDCGKWFSDAKNILDKDERAVVKRGGHDG